MSSLDRRTMMTGAGALLLAGAAQTSANDFALVYDATCFKVGVPADASAFHDQALYQGARAMTAHAAEAAALFRDRRIIMAFVPQAEVAALLAEPDLALARV